MAGLTTTILAGVAAATGLAGTAYNIAASESARGEAEKQMKKQDAAQRSLEDQATAEKARVKKQEGDLALQAQRRAAINRSTQGSRSNTILTSPLGVTGNYQRSQKTILGA